MNNKKVIKIISIFSALIPIALAIFLLVALQVKNANKLELKIPSGFPVYKDGRDSKKIKSDEFINNIIELIFNNNQIEKTKFLNSQNKDKEQELFKQVKDLSNKYLINQKEESERELKNFYSKNWLFVLKNIDKFALKFTKYWSLDSTAKASHSEDFLKKIKEKENRSVITKQFKDNYIDNFAIGSESKHLSKNVFYIRKSNMLIRMFAPKNNASANSIEIDKFILFSETKTKTIALKTLADILHTSIHHNDQNGYQIFETELIQKYGYPSLGILLSKEVLTNEKK
ncbi:aromatic motif membrane protein [Mycoplasma putrefaciens]|uniref:Transmembrane protein n=1 Tax=Mycoplasma putrefaciens Mput9231 TaxID=1292033 RepID=M9WCU0_9MOLU|nr:aromatic motif membrane protein [Mycoplasma putrefaciens]AGJ90651.1 Hypothetical protein, predicted transmembrane protein [Mycoplasma putrefaciens Mput9231]